MLIVTLLRSGAVRLFAITHLLVIWGVLGGGVCCAQVCSPPFLTMDSGLVAFAHTPQQVAKLGADTKHLCLCFPDDATFSKLGLLKKLEYVEILDSG